MHTVRICTMVIAPQVSRRISLNLSDRLKREKYKVFFQGDGFDLYCIFIVTGSDTVSCLQREICLNHHEGSVLATLHLN